MAYVNLTESRFPLWMQYAVDLARFRHLCWNLVASDIRARFRRSRIGILWAVVQPLSFALILAYVYGSLFKVESYWIFAVYVFSGMILWEFFTNCINVGMDSLLNAQGYLKQARIPFFIFQLRVPLAAIVIHLAGLGGMLLMMAALGLLPPIGENLLLVPAFLVVMLAFGTGLTVLFSTIGTQFRDARYVVGIALQGLLFLSPVFLDRNFMDSSHVWLLKYINPFVAFSEMFRGPLLYGAMWSSEDMIIMSCWIGGVWVLALAFSLKFGRRIVYSL